jgi:hypothetical protein
MTPPCRCTPFYPNVEIYTGQLQRLQTYVNENPQSSAGHFVLAYHYLTQGHNDAAARELKQVVGLKPSDAVAKTLLQQIDAANGNSAAQPPQPPGAAATAPATPIDTTVPEGATINGTWSAKPNADTSVSMTIQPDGTFRWDLNLKGQAKQFTGTSTFGNGLLTLLPENVPPIVGKVSWTDTNHMTFHAVGDNSAAGGLSFSKP